MFNYVLILAKAEAAIDAARHIKDVVVEAGPAAIRRAADTVSAAAARFAELAEAAATAVEQVGPKLAFATPEQADARAKCETLIAQCEAPALAGAAGVDPAVKRALLGLVAELLKKLLER